MKKLGFGFMRLPLLDADDPTNVDVSQVTQMVEMCIRDSDRGVAG